MKFWALNHYRCPIGGGPLTLVPFEEEQIALAPGAESLLARLGLPIEAFRRQIRAGVLLSDQYWFPIFNSTPILLDFDNPIANEFEAQYGNRRDAWRGRRRPDRKARAGELISQRTFTTEWNTLHRDDELTFTYSHEERREFIELELEWHARQNVPKDFKILDIGCGSGLESLFIAQVTERPVFGVDLNLAILRAAPELRQHPFSLNCVASVFALPFGEQSFDLVYSHGVLHHTYSTVKAFDGAIRPLKPSGEACIWVYALEDAQRGNLPRKVTYIVELYLRPWIAGAPAALQSAIMHIFALRHFLRYRRRGLKRDMWRYRHSIHSMRDRWTCRFAHRHSFHEVIGWFLQRGFSYKLLDPMKYRAMFKRNLIGVGIRGARTSVSPAAASRSVDSVPQ